MTRRKEIIEILKDNPLTLSELARMFRVTPGEIVLDLNHISFTQSKALRQIPAVCNTCGFVFKDREKKSRPTKCPKCRSEDITQQKFFISGF